MKKLTMNDGHSIPTMGYGTWKVSDHAAEDLVATAIEAGYRHIDTAAIYDNETGVGKGITASGVERSQLFITTKLKNADQADPASALKISLQKLGLDYVDLYLIHWPVPSKNLYPDAWRTLIELRNQGLTRSIGVSNFLEPYLDALESSEVLPAVNQIEYHPSNSGSPTVAANTRRGILTECYTPLGRGHDLEEPVLGVIADRLGATPSQVVLAWELAKNFIVIPKSATPARIRENFAAQDLSLTATDMAAIDALNRGNRLAANPAEYVGY